MIITTEFNEISFHDSPLNKVERVEGRILLSIEDAFLAATHPDSQGQAQLLMGCILRFDNVTEDEATIYPQQGETFLENKPLYPLAEIMEIKVNGSTYQIKERNPIFWFKLRVMLHTLKETCSNSRANVVIAICYQ